MPTRHRGLKNEKTEKFKVGDVSTPRVPSVAQHKRERVKIRSLVFKTRFRCGSERIASRTKD